MGSGFGANYADVVTEEFISDILREVGQSTLLQMFYDAFPEGGLSESELTFCRDEWSDLQNSRYETLVDVFNDVTGLELSIGYHNSSQDGDRYDDVDGIFWSVEGVYEHTKAGERYKDKISRSFYVSYG